MQNLLSLFKDECWQNVCHVEKKKKLKKKTKVMLLKSIKNPFTFMNIDLKCVLIHALDPLILRNEVGGNFSNNRKPAALSIVSFGTWKGKKKKAN